MATERAQAIARDEVALLEAVARADIAAFRALCTRYRQRLHRAAATIVQSASDADDIVQDVWATVWHRAADYRPDRGGPGAWLLAITRHRAIDRARANARRQSLHTELSVLALIDAAGVELGWTADAGLVLRRGNLTSGEIAALELSYLGGLTHREVAAVLGLPLGTVKARIRRGITKTRCAIGAELAAPRIPNVGPDAPHAGPSARPGSFSCPAASPVPPPGE